MRRFPTLEKKLSPAKKKDSVMLLKKESKAVSIAKASEVPPRKVKEDKKFMRMARDKRFYRMISQRVKQDETKIYDKRKGNFGHVFFTEHNDFA